MEALKRACIAVGNQTALAKSVGVGPSAVTNWFKRECIPSKHVLKIERASGVPRHELRPDLYPVEH